MLARHVARAVARRGVVPAAAPAAARFMTANARTADVVVVDYKELTDPSVSLLDRIERAYGFDGIGLMAVRNVPGYAEARQELLPLARQLALAPESTLAELEDAKSLYSVGWSRGKEKFQGEPDFSKGSFYANPEVDHAEGASPELTAKYPAIFADNIWPTAFLPELEPAFKRLGQLLVSVGGMVAHHCDRLVAESMTTYAPGRLEGIVRNCHMHKGRLLYYYPVTEADVSARRAKFDGAGDDTWCGWHNDHGSLTGLTTAMYFTPDGEVVPNPEDAGLSVRSRTGEVLNIYPPEDCMAFQIGETAQIHSGGVLQATPHAVRAGGEAGTARATLAVFMQPDFDVAMDMPSGTDPESVLRGSRGEALPPGVPSLEGRWRDGETFAQFAEATVQSYY